MFGWIKTDHLLPKEGVKVLTKIDDSDGVRNEAVLFRQGSLWYSEDGSMYVYYTPTHWRSLREDRE